MTNDELKSAIAERHIHKRELGVPIDARGSSIKTEIESGLAEKYACDELGCEFNIEIFDGNDGGFDLIYRGYSIDVKWLGISKQDAQPRTNGRIIVDVKKIDRCDLYIAVSGSENRGFKCVGWCTREDLLNAPKWKSDYPDIYGNYMRYAMHTRFLREMKDLKNIHEK